jgi:hypothetical protein
VSTETDYAKYRGKCRELSETAVSADPSLRLVRGYYHCPFWGRQQHWWTVRPDGTIHDPTAQQFPPAGMGEYEEFDGNIDCEYCGKTVAEHDAHKVDHHVYCSYKCYGHDIGF